ncbi:MAG: DegT/DnrJ/EryC1/StrS family aminotransferase [Candidatus Paceibacterota bacterium]
MKIIFNDFKKQYNDHKKEIDSAIKRVLSSGWYILGEEGKSFERKFAEYIGVKHAIGVANGLEAIQIALIANGIKPGDEVITTSHSAVATALAIKAIGAKPIFVDIDEFFHIDAKQIEKKITEKTKAIIPVHLYGQSADMETIVKLAKKHKLQIIEDCAQAHGAKFNKKTVGTFGSAGCFSFYPTKNLGAFGDAGAIVTDDDSIAEKCREIRNYGQKNRYEHEIIGINSRLDELQAAILSELLPDLDNKNKRRVEIADIYKKELKNIKQIKLPKVRGNTDHVYHLFVIEVDKRNELQAFLKKNEIDTLIHYPIPIHKQKCFAEFNKLSLPKLEKTVNKILSLPIHPYLKNEEVLFVCNKIKEFYGI